MEDDDDADLRQILRVIPVLASEKEWLHLPDKL